jgi:hypothetical protein
MMRIRTLACLIAICAFAWASPGYAQNVTTGTITGVIRDAQGGVLPGATVTATHTPTGTVYEGFTGADGTFSLLNVRVGGPYDVEVVMPSFRSERRTGVQVNLGQSTALDVTLQLETLTETVTVTADASSLFSPSMAGTSANIEQGVIENLPTVQRSFQDFARVNPFFVPNASNADPTALSVAGRNTRYNNVQIDGAVNNDIFGLAATGTPGGQADTQPIGIEAIQELQLVVAPYDVRQGGFSGGGVNAITKSGTNDLRGSAFFFTRDQDLVGTGIDDRPIATFSDKQFGGSLGGPMVRNKAFFFGNMDWGRKDTPSGFSIDGASGVSFGREAEAQRFLDILQNRYGYNPGGLGEFIRETKSDKLFLRTDFNVTSGHQLTVRHNYVDALNDVGTQSNTTYKFPDNFYRFNSQTNTTVAQLNSNFGTMVNEFRFTAQRVRENRGTETRFPQVTVRLPDGGRFVAGTEQFSTANELDQDNIEITNDLTLVRGGHTITVGTHNEFFKFRNLFIRDNFGTYEFASLDTLEAGTAQLFDYSFSLTGDPRFPARFPVYQLGFYAGDQWRLRPNFTLTYGVRWDKPIFPDEPTANPDAEALYGVRTNVVPETQTWSPRAGFNWDLSNESDLRQQVRGGFGLFGGRTPYVWLSNQYGNTGIEFRRVSVSPFNVANNVPFNPNPDAQPTALGRAATNEIDVIDPDYSFPQLLRGNIAYDRSLVLGLVGSVELLYSKTVKDIDYENLNLAVTSTNEDGRPRYGRINPAYSDVVFLTNTDEGDAWTIATKLERPFRNGWYASGSYVYGRARSVNDGNSSQARSNWINVYTAGDINNPPLATSNFDVQHRITLAATYTFNLRAANITTSMYYNGQSGRPYSYNFGSDVNNDGSSTNDLLYYPLEGEVTITNGTYQDLVNFLEAGGCSDLVAGEIVERNTCRMPWTNGLDFHVGVDVPIGRFRPEFTFDIQNLLNLFNREWGQVEFAQFNDILVSNATVAPTGDYSYSINAPARPGGVRYTRDDLRSRWQAQMGFRVRF